MSQRGFTLIEILMVILMMGIASWFVTNVAISSVNEEKYQATLNEMQIIYTNWK